MSDSSRIDVNLMRNSLIDLIHSWSVDVGGRWHGGEMLCCSKQREALSEEQGLQFLSCVPREPPELSELAAEKIGELASSKLLYKELVLTREYLRNFRRHAVAFCPENCPVLSSTAAELAQVVIARWGHEPDILSCDIMICSRIQLRASDFDWSNLRNFKKYLEQNSFIVPTLTSHSDGVLDFSINIPSLIVMYGQATDKDPPTKCRMISTSASTFLSSIGIVEHPVWGLYADESHTYWSLLAAKADADGVSCRTTSRSCTRTLISSLCITEHRGVH